MVKQFSGDFCSCIWFQHSLPYISSGLYPLAAETRPYLVTLMVSGVWARLRWRLGQFYERLPFPCEWQCANQIQVFQSITCRYPIFRKPISEQSWTVSNTEANQRLPGKGMRGAWSHGGSTMAIAYSQLVVASLRTSRALQPNTRKVRARFPDCSRSFIQRPRGVCLSEIYFFHAQRFPKGSPHKRLKTVQKNHGNLLVKPTETQ